MPNYTVQLQFDVSSLDFGDIQVTANSPEEARKVAMSLYLSDNCPDIDYYQSNSYESSLTEEYEDWQVTQHKEN